MEKEQEREKEGYIEIENNSKAEMMKKHSRERGEERDERS
jgi:hypothetical protein